MIGADDILVHYILKSEYTKFQPSRILQLKRGFIAYLRWTIAILVRIRQSVRGQKISNVKIRQKKIRFMFSSLNLLKGESS